jgi:SAM-dependent methyltransferase
MFSIDHLHVIRTAEIDVIASLLPSGGRLLELGAGTGEQARTLAGRGYDVVALELRESTYAAHRVFDIIDYDGCHIPFPEGEFDVVYSSNVLEHVRDLDALHQEVRRVLKPGGYCVHVVPSAAWRLWTSIVAFPEMIAAVRRVLPQLWHSTASSGAAPGLQLRCLAVARELALPFVPLRHGARGNALTELWTFSRRRWTRHFAQNGFVVEYAGGTGLFYTGNMYFGRKWTIPGRRRAAAVLGSACNVFRVRPVATGARVTAARTMGRGLAPETSGHTAGGAVANGMGPC